MASRTPPPPPLGLVLIRAMTGYLLLKNGWAWVRGDSLDGALVLEYVRSAVAEQSSWIAWYGDTVILSNPDAFAFFWRWAALIFGCALFLGALTRPAGTLAAIVLLHGVAFGPAELELVFWILAVTAFACALSSAGRRIGMDSVLDRDCPSWLTWTQGRKSTQLFP